MGEREEFESEMEDYLAERRREPVLQGILKRKPESPDAQESPETYDAPESWWSRMRGRFFGREEPAVEAEPPQEDTELLTDFKTVAKLTLSVMKQLPEEQLVALKNSQEFSQFKEILRKYNLIK